MNNTKIPRISLIGFGKFGRQYYFELCRLEREHKIQICAIATRTGNANGTNINHRVYDEATYRELVLIGQIDIFVVVVPMRVRVGIIEHYSMLGNVLVEKPVCTSRKEVNDIIKAQGKTSFAIEVSQIFRYHPIAIMLKDHIDDISHNIVEIESVFVNSTRHSYPDDQVKQHLTAEMNHMLDLAFYLTDTWKCKVSLSLSKQNLIELACINVSNNLCIRSTAGWADTQENQRTLNFMSNDLYSIKCDFVHNTVSYLKPGEFHKEHFKVTGSLIAAQLKDFIQHCDIPTGEHQQSQAKANISQALQLVSLLYPRTSKSPSASIKKRVAVIGGGIFGATIAIRMAKTFEVDLYETASDLLTGATLNNQWRHHSGFHYPLSHETIKEIVEHKALFEHSYSDCIRRDAQSFYFVSTWAQEINAKRYLASMNLFGLKYDIVSCPRWVNPESVSLSLLTDEAVYDICLLREKIKNKLCDLNVNVLTSHEVIKVDISTCKKIVFSVSRNASSNPKHNTYDFIVDCTNGLGCYELCGLPDSDMKVRVELVELIELQLDLPKLCLTFIDAPFMSLTTMGNEGDFMLSHRDHSLHARYFVAGNDKKTALSQVPLTSSYQNLFAAAKEYIPDISKATYKGSRYAWKGISPYSKEVWERPTVIRDHGFGLISVIAGKILTSVSNAKEVEQLILSYC
ncbi:FAD-dependent oxidoreductase [Synechococcus sp. Tobar12-5m-g]|nr:FAD-dependent oxidoreductase [Synechococcus sp. Tobar12-5m-g]MCP9874612.1 FAD-dependent oxidoreductase [Synechococcus sp. Cruz CV-v-12]